MSTELAIVITVIICSIIQSFFGVGLLVFGTPVLLLLGVPFQQALIYLLPCSIFVSALQVVEGWSLIQIKQKIFFLMLPSILVGVFLIFYLEKKLNARIPIGILLLVTTFLRLTSIGRTLLKEFFQKRENLSLISIGLIHGLTNMGGSLLTIYASNVFRGKNVLRANIALIYLLMASTQMAYLTVMHNDLMNSLLFLIVPLSGCIFLLLGNRIFRIQKNTDQFYQNLLSGFILLLALLMLT